MSDMREPQRRWIGMGPAAWTWIIGIAVVAVVLLLVVGYWGGGQQTAQQPGTPAGTTGQSFPPAKAPPAGQPKQ